MPEIIFSIFFHKPYLLMFVKVTHAWGMCTEVSCGLCVSFLTPTKIGRWFFKRKSYCYSVFPPKSAHFWVFFVVESFLFWALFTVMSHEEPHKSRSLSVPKLEETSLSIRISHIAFLLFSLRLPLLFHVLITKREAFCWSYYSWTSFAWFTWFTCQDCLVKRRTRQDSYH